jgi:hypothetical protein
MTEDLQKKLIAQGLLPDPEFQPRETSKNRFGRMIYGYKTAGSIEVLTKESFQATQKYHVANGARSCVKNFSKNICS